MDERYLGEFLGTMVLILMGNGVVANVLLKRSKAEGAGWIVITAGWAFAVVCGIFVSKALGGDGLLNPGVLIFFIVSCNRTVAPCETNSVFLFPKSAMP